jgi:hypothetical protein
MTLLFIILEFPTYFSPKLEEGNGPVERGIFLVTGGKQGSRASGKDAKAQVEGSKVVGGWAGGG